EARLSRRPPVVMVIETRVTAAFARLSDRQRGRAPRRRDISLRAFSRLRGSFTKLSALARALCACGLRAACSAFARTFCACGLRAACSALTRIFCACGLRAACSAFARTFCACGLRAACSALTRAFCTCGPRTNRMIRSINAMVRSSPALYRPTTARSRKFGARGGTHGFRRRDARKRGRAGGTGRPPLRRPPRGSVAAAAAAAEPGQEPAGLGLGARVAGHPLDPRPRPPALRTLEVPSDPVDDGHVSSLRLALTAQRLPARKSSEHQAGISPSPPPESPPPARITPSWRSRRSHRRTGTATKRRTRPPGPRLQRRSRSPPSTKGGRVRLAATQFDACSFRRPPTRRGV